MINMEDQGEVMGSKDYTQIIRGKRTKRQRQESLLALTMATSSSTSIAEEGGGSGGGGENSGGLDIVATSPTNSIELMAKSTEEEEEEDMANCLILLAQGGGQTLKPPERVAPTTNKAAGLYVYECKTCNRCFPSFQALGGHRASHKKLKATQVEGKKAAWLLGEEDRFESETTTLSLQISNRVLSSSNKSKVHECSVCGADFTSGQALGGHMRRHRSVTMVPGSPESTQEAKKPRGILSLDLNLPAPEAEHRESKLIPFSSKGKVMVFSASSLIDCHY
ncbi:zinc finger protein ZAT5-like [Cornus florida]|uniref:zinc finger protein ZAT5-like n=1 Tax=Cornus florida TaxID=4283 RepID=UPI0028965468|nr:zinc finger protein ZAT5-like [Cornus florida]